MQAARLVGGTQTVWDERDQGAGRAFLSSGKQLVRVIGTLTSLLHHRSVCGHQSTVSSGTQMPVHCCVRRNTNGHVPLITVSGDLFALQ